MALFKFWFLHLEHYEDDKKKTYMLTIYPSNKCDLKINYIDNVFLKWMDQKMLKNPMRKTMFFIIYQRTKVQKMKGLKKPN